MRTMSGGGASTFLCWAKQYFSINRKTEFIVYKSYNFVKPYTFRNKTNFVRPTPKKKNTKQNIFTPVYQF